MSLVADYSDSNSSSTFESEDSDSSIEKIESHVTEKSSLPSASSLLSKKSGEVFQNRYQQEEQTKKASLEQHVKMVEKDEHLKTKNGKKICWNYRKGRCRFGSKCQYAHDSDLATELIIPQTTSDESSITNTQDVSKTINLTKDSKRKRPGLGDSLVPGKRVMKAYVDQQQKS